MLNYSPNIARKDPASIYNFYEHITMVKAVGDTSDCCKHDQMLIIAQVDSDEKVSETDSEADLTSELKNLDYSLNHEHSYSSSSVSHTDMVQDFETALHDFTGNYRSSIKMAHDSLSLKLCTLEEHMKLRPSFDTVLTSGSS